MKLPASVRKPYFLITLFLQAKRRLALDESDHQYQLEPARTPRSRGGGPAANGTRIKTPRSKAMYFQAETLDSTSHTDFLALIGLNKKE